MELQLIDKTWLPKVEPHGIQHVISHWTAGANYPSADDLTHYHILIDKDGKLYRGTHSIAQNARPFNSDKPYAAHTKDYNAGSVGVAMCGMRGAVESPFHAGDQPITQVQWMQAALCAAQVCLVYQIDPMTYIGIMQHGEVQLRTGTTQRGKWDVNKLPFAPSYSPEKVQRMFRLVAQAGYKLMHAGATLTQVETGMYAVLASLMN